MRQTIDELEQSLRAILGDGVSRDAKAREDASTDLLGSGATAALVATPATVEELAQAVAAVTQGGLAVVPRGGGLTYVAGYTPAAERFVAFDLRRLNRIVEISEQDMIITVEAGVTWKQIYEALSPLGLRLPFFGTFSGRAATVGGGLSNGALFLGTARYGSAAEIVLGLQVVLADGALLHTGQLAVAQATSPFFRTFGPDTTGLFVHDSGALGIKARATLRLIRMPAHSDYLSFGFTERGQAMAALSEIARSEVAEECYLMDPDKTRAALTPADFARDVQMLGKVIGGERSLLRGLKAGAKLVLAGRDFVEQGCWSLHMVLAGRSEGAVADDVAATRTAMARMGGRELPASLPRAARADLFAPLANVLGPTGDRWIALNAKIAHSEASALVDAAEALIASHRPALDRYGVVVSRLLNIMSTHAFSYEAGFNWHDSWLPMHHATLPAEAQARLTEPAANAEARALVMQIRGEIVALFARHGAASNQIGRTYPYASILRPEARALLEGLKRLVDPRGLVNPGALEL